MTVDEMMKVVELRDLNELAETTLKERQKFQELKLQVQETKKIVEHIITIFSATLQEENSLVSVVYISIQNNKTKVAVGAEEKTWYSSNDFQGKNYIIKKSMQEIEETPLCLEQLKNINIIVGRIPHLEGNFANSRLTVKFIDSDK